MITQEISGKVVSCSSCAAPREPDAKFCTHCGGMFAHAPLELQTPKHYTPSSNGNLVVYGANEHTLNLAGHSIGDIFDALQEVLNMVGNCDCHLDGNSTPADWGTIVGENQTLEFIRAN